LMGGDCLFYTNTFGGNWTNFMWPAAFDALCHAWSGKIYEWNYRTMRLWRQKESKRDAWQVKKSNEENEKKDAAADS
jgi:hypothetical protein